MYLDFGDICLSLAALGVLCMTFIFIKTIVDVYILDKCDDGKY